MVETGEMIGPRIYSTGDVIYGTESVFPVVYEAIGSIEDARHIVRRFKAYDPAMLKQYMQPRRDQRQWLRQAAAEEGVMITAEGGVDWVLDMTMVLDGYTAVEHNLPIELHDDVIQLYARSGTNYTPTLVVAYGGPSVELYFHNQGNYHDSPKLRRFVPEAELDSWRRYQHIPEEEWHFRTVVVNAQGVVRVLPVSTGSGKEFFDDGQTSIAYTPRGRFIVYDKIAGWEAGPIGRMYYPNYISGGIAIHGSRSVPVRPATHGCIRIPMHAAREASKLLKLQTIVLVYDKVSFVSGRPWAENPKLKQAASIE
jgi:hypothetical protein